MPSKKQKRAILKKIRAEEIRKAKELREQSYAQSNSVVDKNSSDTAGAGANSATTMPKSLTPSQRDALRKKLHAKKQRGRIQDKVLLTYRELAKEFNDWQRGLDSVESDEKNNAWVCLRKRCQIQLLMMLNERDRGEELLQDFIADLKVLLTMYGEDPDQVALFNNPLKQRSIGSDSSLKSHYPLAVLDAIDVDGVNVDMDTQNHFPDERVQFNQKSRCKEHILTCALNNHKDKLVSLTLGQGEAKKSNSRPGAKAAGFKESKGAQTVQESPGASAGVVVPAQLAVEVPRAVRRRNNASISTKSNITISFKQALKKTEPNGDSLSFLNCGPDKALYEKELQRRLTLVERVIDTQVSHSGTITWLFELANSFKKLQETMKLQLPGQLYCCCIRHVLWLNDYFVIALLYGQSDLVEAIVSMDYEGVSDGERISAMQSFYYSSIGSIASLVLTRLLLNPSEESFDDVLQRFDDCIEIISLLKKYNLVWLDHVCINQMVWLLSHYQRHKAFSGKMLVLTELMVSLHYLTPDELYRDSSTKYINEMCIFLTSLIKRYCVDLRYERVLLAFEKHCGDKLRIEIKKHGIKKPISQVYFDQLLVHGCNFAVVDMLFHFYTNAGYSPEAGNMLQYLFKIDQNHFPLNLVRDVDNFDEFELQRSRKVVLLKRVLLSSCFIGYMEITDSGLLEAIRNNYPLTLLQKLIPIYFYDNEEGDKSVGGFCKTLMEAIFHYPRVGQYYPGELNALELFFEYLVTSDVRKKAVRQCDMVAWLRQTRAIRSESQRHYAIGQLIDVFSMLECVDVYRGLFDVAWLCGQENDALDAVAHFNEIMSLLYNKMMVANWFDTFVEQLYHCQYAPNIKDNARMTSILAHKFRDYHDGDFIVFALALLYADSATIASLELDVNDSDHKRVVGSYLHHLQDYCPEAVFRFMLVYSSWSEFMREHNLVRIDVNKIEFIEKQLGTRAQFVIGIMIDAMSTQEQVTHCIVPLIQENKADIILRYFKIDPDTIPNLVAYFPTFRLIVQFAVMFEDQGSMDWFVSYLTRLNERQKKFIICLFFSDKSIVPPEGMKAYFSELGLSYRNRIALQYLRWNRSLDGMVSAGMICHVVDRFYGQNHAVLIQLLYMLQALLKYFGKITPEIAAKMSESEWALSYAMQIPKIVKDKNLHEWVEYGLCFDRLFTNENISIALSFMENKRFSNARAAIVLSSLSEQMKKRLQGNVSLIVALMARDKPYERYLTELAFVRIVVEFIKNGQCQSLMKLLSNDKLMLDNETISQQLLATSVLSGLSKWQRTNINTVCDVLISRGWLTTQLASSDTQLYVGAFLSNDQFNSAIFLEYLMQDSEVAFEAVKKLIKVHFTNTKMLEKILEKLSKYFVVSSKGAKNNIYELIVSSAKGNVGSFEARWKADLKKNGLFTQCECLRFENSALGPMSFIVTEGSLDALRGLRGKLNPHHYSGVIFPVTKHVYRLYLLVANAWFDSQTFDLDKSFVGASKQKPKSRRRDVVSSRARSSVVAVASGRLSAGATATAAAPPSSLPASPRRVHQRVFSVLTPQSVGEQEGKGHDGPNDDALPVSGGGVKVDRSIALFAPISVRLFNPSSLLNAILLKDALMSHQVDEAIALLRIAIPSRIDSNFAVHAAASIYAMIKLLVACCEHDSVDNVKAYQRIRAAMVHHYHIHGYNQEQMHALLSRCKNLVELFDAKATTLGQFNEALSQFDVEGGQEMNYPLIGVLHMQSLHELGSLFKEKYLEGGAISGARLEQFSDLPYVMAIQYHCAMLAQVVKKPGVKGIFRKVLARDISFKMVRVRNQIFHEVRIDAADNLLSALSYDKMASLLSTIVSRSEHIANYIRSRNSEIYAEIAARALCSGLT